MRTTLTIIAILTNSIFMFGQNPNLITDFKQTKVVVSESFQKCSNDKKLGNCVAIAVIKCALGQFGSIEKVYKSFRKNDNGSFDIEFYDGFKISVTPEEINIARNISGIKANDSAAFFDDAIIIYASMSKRIYEKRNEFSKKCIQSFTNAVEYLNSGFPTKNGNNLLGLDKTDLSVEESKVEPNAVIWCSAHAAYVSSGTQDLLGEAIQLKGNKMRNLARYRKIKGGYKLKVK
jgi:hypothetical protein